MLKTTLEHVLSHTWSQHGSVLFNQNNLGENRTFKKLSTTVTLLLSSALNKQHFTDFNKFLSFKLFFSS